MGIEMKKKKLSLPDIGELCVGRLTCKNLDSVECRNKDGRYYIGTEDSFYLCKHYEKKNGKDKTSDYNHHWSRYYSGCFFSAILICSVWVSLVNVA
jgi:hypothetical protein